MKIKEKFEKETFRIVQQLNESLARAHYYYWGNLERYYTRIVGEKKLSDYTIIYGKRKEKNIG